MSWEEQDRDELGRWGSGGSAAGPKSEAAGIPSPKRSAQTTARMMTKVGRYHPDTEPSYDQRRELKREVAEKTGARATEIANERGVSHEEIMKASEVYGYKNPTDGYGYMSPENFEMMGREYQMRSLTAGMVTQWASSSGDHDTRSMATQIAAKQEFDLSDSDVDHFSSRGSAWEPALAIADVEGEGGSAMRAVLRAQYERTQEALRDAGIESVTLYRGTSQDLRGSFLRGAPDTVTTQPLSSFTSDPNVALDYGGREGYVVAIQVPADRILSVPSTGFGAWNEAEVVVLGGEYKALITSGGDVYDSGAGSRHHPGSADPERKAAASERASEFAALTRALHEELPPPPTGG